MLTQAQNQAARAAAADFSAACADYRAVLARYELPLTVDLAQVESIYRGRLFEQLLAADAGLRARYEMAQTREGKQRIQADTMAGISLAGHELPAQIAQALADLERAHRTLPQLNDVPRLPLGSLLSGYGLDYGRLLDQYTMQWAEAGRDTARAYFEHLGQVLTGWQAVVRASGGGEQPLPVLLERLARYFEPHQAGQPVQVNEQFLYQQFTYHPDLLAVLATPATSPYRQLAQQLLDDPRLRGLLSKAA